MKQIEVKNLSIDFGTQSGIVHALDRVSFSLEKGKTLGLVGESGSGKSVLSLAIIGLLDPAAKIKSGSILFEGNDLIKLSQKERRQLMGHDFAMIFQNPKAALNPIISVGRQLEDILERSGKLTKKAKKALAIAALEEVKIPDPERRYHAYPYELSGGMAQRVMIAIALACRSKLLIADEPTTGLDVTTQKAVLELIQSLSRSHGLSVILVTHDLSLAGEYCDEVAVMHAGHLIEQAPCAELFRHQLHPYTKKLFNATLSAIEKIEDVKSIKGNLPDLRRIDLPQCRYAERCDFVKDICVQEFPLLQGTERLVSCHRVDEITKEVQ